MNDCIIRKIYDDRLYFISSGAGIIRCLECDFEQEIVSFLHGVNRCSTGYQCQKCGKFHAVENEINHSSRRRCECGGKLNRDKPLFCPKCRSNHVTYEVCKLT